MHLTGVRSSGCIATLIIRERILVMEMNVSTESYARTRLQRQRRFSDMHCVSAVEARSDQLARQERIDTRKSKNYCHRQLKGTNDYSI